MKKRKLAAMITAAMLLSTVAGCAGGGTDQTAAEGDGAQQGGDPVKITAMIWDRGQETAAGTTITDNALTDFIHDQVLAEKNVDVEFMAVPRNSSDDKINAMMAAGNAPDVILTYDRDIFMDYATNNGLTDVTELVAEYGPNIQAIGDEVLSAGYVDGKQYAVMGNRSIQTSKHVAFIRTDWLEAVGKEVPTTTEELVDVLYAFKEQDPGNLGEKNVPWAIGGDPNAERYFMNFCISFIDDLQEGATPYLYQYDTAIMHPDAKEGLKLMNQMYNDGIISKDFAVDTNDDKYVQDICNGFADFMTEDPTKPYDNWLGTTKDNVPEAHYIACAPFTGHDDVQEVPADPLYGIYVMIPKASEDKAEAVVKYLDWIANVDNAMKVEFTPDYTTDESGIPISLTNDEKLAKGYPLNTGDFNILNKYWPYYDDKAKVAQSYKNYNWKGDFPLEDYQTLVDVSTSNIFVYPTYETPMPEAANYGTTVKEALMRMAYKSISAPVDQFEAVYAEEYEKVMQAGFEKMLAERQAYYDSLAK